MKKKYLIFLLVFMAVVAIGAFFSSAVRQQKAWLPVKQGPIISAIYGLGTVTSNKIYQLKVGVATHVQHLYVHEGDEVQAGQPLVQFSSLPLYKADFSGTITSLSLHVNETVYPQNELLTLMDLSDCYIRVALEQEAAVKIHKGQKVKLSFSGLPNQTFEGIVTSVYPKDQESYAKIAVNKLPGSILPDMSSDVAIILDQKENALLIPTQAIQNSKITLRRAGQIKQILVQLGTINDEYAEVISKNLQSGDEVLVKA